VFRRAEGTPHPAIATRGVRAYREVTTFLSALAPMLEVDPKRFMDAASDMIDLTLNPARPWHPRP